MKELIALRCHRKGMRSTATVCDYGTDVWIKSADEIIAKIGRSSTRTLAVSGGQE